MTLMQRRRALMGAATNANEITLESPTDFSIIECCSNFYKLSTGQHNFVVEADHNRDKTRRCVCALSGTVKPCASVDKNSNIDGTSIYYPISVPDGVTKIKSIYSNISGLQAIVFGAIWSDNDWTSTAAILNTDWSVIENLTNIPLASCTHITVAFRVDGRNTKFTAETSPTLVKIIFE